MLAALAALAVAASAWAATGLVRTVRCSSTGESARVVIDLSRPLEYDVALSADSSALVVEIPRAVSESSLGEVMVGSTLNYKPNGQGFFLQPASSRSNNVRIYVVTPAIRHMRFV